MRLHIRWPKVFTWFARTPPIEAIAPSDEASVARAKAAQSYERFLNNVDEDGHVRKVKALSHISRGAVASFELAKAMKDARDRELHEAARIEANRIRRDFRVH